MGEAQELKGNPLKDYTLFQVRGDAGLIMMAEDMKV